MGLSSKKAIADCLLQILQKKALQSPSTFLVSAAAYSKHGNLLGTCSNGFKGFVPKRRGAGMHAEQKLIRKFGKKIDTIYIIRCGHDGERLPIHACENCAKMAEKLGIKIVSLHEEFGYKSTDVYP